MDMYYTDCETGGCGEFNYGLPWIIWMAGPIVCKLFNLTYKNKIRKFYTGHKQSL